MRIVVEDFCFNTNLSIDEKQYEDLDEQNKIKIVDKILNRIREKITVAPEEHSLIELLEFLEISEYEADSKPCESCGHYYQSKTYEL